MGSYKHPNEFKGTHDFYVKASHGHFTDPVGAMLCTDYQEEDKLTRIIQLTDIHNNKVHFSFTTDRSANSPFCSPCGMAFDPKDLNKVFHLFINASESDDINGTINIDGNQVPAHLETASEEEVRI